MVETSWACPHKHRRKRQESATDVNVLYMPCTITDSRKRRSDTLESPPKDISPSNSSASPASSGSSPPTGRTASAPNPRRKPRFTATGISIHEWNFVDLTTLRTYFIRRRVGADRRTFTTHDGTMRSKHKAALLSAAWCLSLFSFVMPGIGECNPPVPEGPFPLSQSSRAQGLQEVGQRPVQRTVKRKLVETSVSQAGEER